MSQPLVSVVLPIYKVEKFIDRCITSVVNQTYNNLEIILVDDGSPDNCPMLCDEWAEKDPRIKVIHKQNAGLGMARNTGIENATGQFICFFDSDDYVDKTTVEKCIANITENNSDIVLFGYSDVYEDGKTVPIPLEADSLVYSDKEIIDTLLPSLLTLAIKSGISAWSKMYRLDIIKKNNIKFKSEREIISEDAYFALELFGKISRVSVINESLYYYYKNSNSLTNTYNKERQAKNDIYLQKSLEFCDSTGYPQKVSDAVVVRYHSYTIVAIKQVLKSSLSNKEKKNEIDKIFKNSVLVSSLKKRIINTEKTSLQVFWYALKLKQYWLCKMLLLYRLKVKD